MAQNRFSHASSLSDDIYGATPQHTGGAQGSAPRSPRNNAAELGTTSASENPFNDGDEKPPALPPRPPSLLNEQGPPAYPSEPIIFYRSDERVMAYMIPLPQPVRPSGIPIDVPQRYMLYLPPAPDRLKPSPSSGTKERKRDKCVRKWQAEVRKAKTTQNRSKTSFSGIYHATVRGAVYCLALIQRSELTFLSRLPRKTLRDLCFVHPAAERTAERAKFELVKEEFRRNNHVAKRDFWIGAAVLPFAQGIDIAIPIGGGFSEVTLAWMIVTGTAWKTSNGMLQRLEFRDGNVPRGNLGGPENVRRDDNANGNLNDDAESSSDDEDLKKDKASRWKMVKGKGKGKGKGKAKEKKPPVEMNFRPSTSLDKISHYIRATCHICDPELFPDVGQPSSEIDVLRSIGWAPIQRESEDPDGDIAWQIQKTTEDLKAAVTKCGKTWGKFCATYAVNPEKALRREERAKKKNLKRQEKEKLKRSQASE